MRACLRVLTVAVALVLAVPGVAGADGESTAYIDEEGNPTVDVVDTTGEPGSGGGDGDCYFRVAIGDDFGMAIYDVDGTRLYSETGRWLELVCDGSIIPIDGQGIVPEGGAVDPLRLAAEARASVLIAGPPIETSPDAARETYTQMTTWLWVDDGWWTPYSATATAGRVSATVTSSPRAATWSTGDGASQVCEGPGVEWRRGLSDDATYCSHVYTTSSDGAPGGTYTLQVTVPFEVTWTSNVGAGGSLDDVNRTSSRSIRVGEIQAIETE